MTRRRLILLVSLALVAWLFTTALISRDSIPAEPGPPNLAARST